MGGPASGLVCMNTPEKPTCKALEISRRTRRLPEFQDVGLQQLLTDDPKSSIAPQTSFFRFLAWSCAVLAFVVGRWGLFGQD